MSENTTGAAPAPQRLIQNEELKAAIQTDADKRTTRINEDFNEAEFFGFAKSYLSEAFPNPQRIGCPPDSDLQRMAEHPVESRDAAVSEHLTRCSPCFNRYMEILAGLRKRSA